jgi:hypothetical protein
MYIYIYMFLYIHIHSCVQIAWMDALTFSFS